MTTTPRTNWEALITAAIAMLGFAFSAGVIDQRLSAVEHEVDLLRVEMKENESKAEARCALADKKRHLAQKVGSGAASH